MAPLPATLFALPIDLAAFEGTGWPGDPAPEARLLALARAVVANPSWRDLGGAALVVRPTPEPVLGAIGRFDDAQRSRLERLHWQLERTLPRLRYLDHDRVERDCERLAERLRERFGAELEGFRFRALPRGGLIVLGVLSYLLGLRQEQLEPAAAGDAGDAGDAPVVVVDDCALSGARFGRDLAASADARVVFAPLYAAPALRDEIERREPRVLACLSARDLHDYAPADHGGDYEAWRRRWLERQSAFAYWVGKTEHLCFPWSEPDIGFWNPATERQERGWMLVPPERCLKNRPPGPSGAVQLQAPGRGPLAPSPTVLHGEFEDGVVVGDLASGRSLALDGVAADMWRAVVTDGSEAEAVRSLHARYEVDETRLRHDLSAFVATLLEGGLLRSAERGAMRGPLP